MRVDYLVKYNQACHLMVSIFKFDFWNASIAAIRELDGDP